MHALDAHFALGPMDIAKIVPAVDFIHMAAFPAKTLLRIMQKQPVQPAGQGFG